MSSKKLSNSDKNAISNLHKQQLNKTTNSLVNKTAPPQKISYTVAHAIPGRIRFRIHRLSTDSDYASKLQRLIESDTRTKNVRINPRAASIVISYEPGIISDDQMRSHLVNLIQIAPNIVLPAKATTKPIVGAFFDALINLIDSTRNINKVRNANTYNQSKMDIWERLLRSAKTFIKGIKSAIIFILPNKRWQSQSHDREVGLQPSQL